MRLTRSLLFLAATTTSFLHETNAFPIAEQDQYQNNRRNNKPTYSVVAVDGSDSNSTPSTTTITTTKTVHVEPSKTTETMALTSVVPVEPQGEEKEGGNEDVDITVTVTVTAAFSPPTPSESSTTTMTVKLTTSSIPCASGATTKITDTGYGVFPSPTPPFSSSRGVDMLPTTTAPLQTAFSALLSTGLPASSSQSSPHPAILPRVDRKRPIQRGH
ncbi:hypothetical protein VTN49DRAFT_6801 [Thermomyces lanuginosus]|uniref:uncharacterized protein n=1 Tax=Thermomyces lanuginosus TaxID=5541 RepID=UPI003742C0AC